MLVLVAVIAAGERLGIRPFPAISRMGRRALPWIRAYVVAAPLTFLYLLVIATTSWVLGSSGGRIDEALLRGHSSNLSALAQDPIRGLVQSAFWVEGLTMFLIAVALGVALAPVERWLGSARWLAVFALGHVGASLLVAAAIWTAIDSGRAPPGLRQVVDVGASYGFAAVAGVAAHRLPRRLGLVYAVGVLVVLAGVLAVDRSFTDLGHVMAFAIGLACAPLTRSPAVGTRRRDHLIPRPTPPAVPRAVIDDGAPLA